MFLILNLKCLSLIAVKWYKVNKVSAGTPLKGLNEAVQKLSESIGGSPAAAFQNTFDTPRKNLKEVSRKLSEIEEGLTDPKTPTPTNRREEEERQMKTFENESRLKTPLKSLQNVDSFGLLTTRYRNKLINATLKC
jgi:uncharacterized protein YukE